MVVSPLQPEIGYSGFEENYFLRHVITLNLRNQGLELLGKVKIIMNFEPSSTSWWGKARLMRLAAVN